MLFQELPGFDAALLMPRLEPLLAGDPVTVLKEEVVGATRYITLRARGCIVTLEAGNAVRRPAAYFEALDWPMLHRTFPDAEDVVRAHRAHVHIRAEAEYDAIANGLGMRPSNTSYARNLLAGRVAMAVCRIAMPTAIHWKGCEMLYKPGPFLREMDTEPIDLFVRVTPFSSNRQVGGVRVIGASTRGAHELLGKEVVLEEAPVPVDWAMRTLQGFVARCHHNGGYLPHLATYAPSRGDIIIVRHLASTPEIQEEHISLEVRCASEPGYDATMADGIAIPPRVTKPAWDGRERRTRPASAKPFGRRGLN
ncbi:MAG: hypothetical protein Kow0026_03110 [Oricola sp.]